MDEGDSQPLIKAEPVEDSDNVGDSANVSQEKSASTGSEGSSDGFVKLDELEDTPTTPTEAVEDLPTQNETPAPEDFTKLTPSTDVTKSSLGENIAAPVDYLQEYYDQLPVCEESKEMPEELVETPQADENGLQEEEDVAAVGDPVEVIETPPQRVDSVEEVEKPAEVESPKEEVVEPCKLYTVLPTSIEKVMDLLYWRDVKASAVAFGLVMLILLTLNHSSALLVFSYFSLSLLTVTMTVKVYTFVMQSVNGTQQPNPFQNLMELDITISNETAQKYLEIVLSKFNCTVVCARDLFLARNLLDSFKFGMFSWFMGYVGLVFNSLTILTIVVALAFTVPVIYEKNQTDIDNCLGLVQSKYTLLMGKIRAIVPGLKPKVE